MPDKAQTDRNIERPARTGLAILNGVAAPKAHGAAEALEELARALVLAAVALAARVAPVPHARPQAVVAVCNAQHAVTLLLCKALLS